MATSAQWDIRGKVCIVTGANSGIGYETAKQLLQLGAGRVILACRNAKLGEEAVKRIRQEIGLDDDAEAERRLALRLLDLASLQSVRQFAEKIIEEEKQLHVLVENAGILPPREKQLTKDGFELGFGTNHLGHFLLTNLLLDLLQKSAPSRVVVVSSFVYTFCWPWGFPIDDPNFENSWYHWWFSYAQSKLANILFARELDRRLNGDDASKPSGVTAYSLHPGMVRTHVYKEQPHWLVRFLTKPIRSYIINAQEGAATTIYCATKPGIESHSGRYFRESNVAEPYAHAKDDKTASQLWDLSERLVASK